ncbi:MAG: dihydroxy-acid dehydratase, partial [Hyphomicrobiaceae bacterium]|nr:dihydroxy-acid dehydratase [Hyphomicrobiaceae bacterium]
FYGTANSNQMLMEIMGLHLPGASFVNPGTPLRDALTKEAARRALSLAATGNNYTPIGEMIDEKAIVNGMIGLLATGGSTNHTLHLIAIAAAAGLKVTWDDMSALSSVVPLLTRVYPNGVADVNHFHAAGGMGFLIRELLDAGLLHNDVKTVWGMGLEGYTVEAKLRDGELAFDPAPEKSGAPKVLATAKEPFSADGGLKVLSGNLGKSVIKISAVKPEHRLVEAPARVFHSQAGLQEAFKAGELTGDMVAVVRFSGPRAIGMPELHKLTPVLGILQDRGLKVALITDGRMSGASGKVPAAIHVTPEAMDGGPIAKVRDGDIIRLDAEGGTLQFIGDEHEFLSRTPASEDLRPEHRGMGRELFAGFRAHVGRADEGASVFGRELA